MHDAVDHAAADQGLADRRFRRPVGPMREQIPYGHRQVMVGVHQPCTRRDNAVPIGVWVIGEGDPVAVLETHEPGHCIRTGAIHANRAVVVDGHEGESRIHLRIDDCNVQPVDLVDGLPVMHGRTA